MSRTSPIESEHGVVQLILIDDLFNFVKGILEDRGLLVVPYQLNNPDDLDTYSVMPSVEPRARDIGKEVVAECVRSGKHLTNCDRDGYCTFCGHQEGSDD